MEWLISNIGSICVSLILLIIVLLITRTLINDKKNGKSSCGCNCAHCALANKCHSQKSHENIAI